MADVENRFTSVAAAGTNQATATVIPRTGIWTVALISGSSPAGVAMPADPFIGDLVELHGGGGCWTYPGSGFTINAVSGGQGIDHGLFRCISSSEWVSVN